MSNETEVNPLQEQIDSLSDRLDKLEAKVNQLATKPIPELKQEPLPVPIPCGPKLIWKKIGGGSLRTATGKIVKPNEIFEASIDELPKLAIQNRQIIQVASPGQQLITIPSPGTIDKVEIQEPVTSLNSYELVEKNAGWYDVINTKTRKAVNEKSLRKTEAEKMLADLS